MELELKYLSPYLPYGLECELEDQGNVKIAKLSGAYIDNSYAFFDTVESEHGYDNIRPILRKISGLKEQIEHNGEKFVPYDKLIRKASGWKYGGLSTENIDTLLEVLNTLDKGYDTIPRWIYQDLIKWHFDVFKLIPSGLAKIKIN